MRSLVLMAVLAAGCGLHKPYLRADTDKPARQCSLPVLVGISQEMPKPLIPSINNAIEYWNEVIGVEVFFNFGILPLSANEYDVFTIIELVPAEDLWDAYWGTCGNTRLLIHGATGCIRYSDIRIAIRCSGSPKIFESIVRHELGHVLGLNDSTDDHSVMSPSYSSMNKHPAEANKKQLQSLRRFYVQDETIR